MKKILITGSKGFIGQNLVSKLKESEEYQILEFDEENSNFELVQFIKQSEIIVHLAGKNRPKEISEYQVVNYGLTETITRILSENGLKVPLVFSSSTQAELDNPYGLSKKQAEDLLLKFSESCGNKVFILRLTNVFGKWSRPNYNSVVSTFCHNIANDISIKINDPESLLRLVYIDDVVGNIVRLIENMSNAQPGYLNIGPIYELKLGKLAELISSFKESRKNLLLPDVNDEFTKKTLLDLSLISR